MNDILFGSMSKKFNMSVYVEKQCNSAADSQMEQRAR